MSFLSKLFTFVLLLLSYSYLQAQSKLDPNTFEKTIKQTPNIQVIDVRTPQEYAHGHLVKCQNININDADFQAKVSKLDKNKPVAVYCAVGGRSGHAATILTKMGFKTVYDLQGGITAWNAAGKTTIK